MKLQQLNERAMQVLFHLTRVDNAAQILQHGVFNLTGSDGGKDRARPPDADWKADHYFLSTARSVQSHFIQDMLRPATVVLVLNGGALTQRNKVRPHVDQDSKDFFDDDFDGNYDEMEERIFSTTPELRLPSPMNRGITAVHMMDLTNPELMKVAMRGEESDVSEQGFQQLQALCKHYNIPLYLYKDFSRFKLLRPQ